MHDMAAACPLETLHVIKIVPAAISHHPTEMNDPAPADRWDCDILVPAGEERLRLIVNQIMEECAALNM
ncbi:hypothetical protein BKA82DRAFT_777850 [Pisolithus tinctorius]|nr:hypothetical protein BKA82DRAFT_777850 [Pisolithus tinctorius]